MSKDTLGDRMKDAYENRYRFYFPNKLPIIVRIDGRAFHTYTRGLKRPFDGNFMLAMQKTTEDLVKGISGCKLGYVQSDEISLLLTNDDTLQTQPWFDNNLQKIVSVSASMATAYFNQHFQELINAEIESYYEEWNTSEEDKKYAKVLESKKPNAMFDARAFVIPKEEVNNYFYWRQLDATRNSILSCAQTYLGKKESFGYKCDELQDRLFLEKGFNWNNVQTTLKRGSCVIYKPTEVIGKNGETIIRNKTFIDNNIPIFSQNPEYINNIVFHGRK